jgi:hypothetical protein
VAGVEDASRFEEQKLHLIRREGFVLNASGNDKHFSCAKMDATITEVDPKIAFDHHEHLVRVLVVVPNEVAL